MQYLFNLCYNAYVPQEVKSNGSIVHINNENYLNIENLNEFECCICLNVINGDVMLTSCLHRFCGECLLTYIDKGGGSCPKCRTEINGIEELIISNPFTEKLNNELVRCSNIECKQIMSRIDYYTHFYKCEYKKEKCENCNIITYVNKSDNIHICLNPQEKCKKCEAVYNVSNSYNHLNVCPYTIIMCKNFGCNKQTTIKDQFKHQNECEYRLLQCRFGCRNIYNKYNIEEHEKMCINRNIQCEKCNMIVSIGLYAYHLDNSCIYSTHICRNCGEKYLLKDNELHINCCVKCVFCSNLFPKDKLQYHFKECVLSQKECDDCKEKYYYCHICKNSKKMCIYCNNEYLVNDEIHHLNLECKEISIKNHLNHK